MKKIIAIAILSIFLISIISSIVPSLYGKEIENTEETKIEDCNCGYYSTDDGQIHSYDGEHRVMSIPIDCTKLSVTQPNQPILDTPDEFSWKNFEGKDWTTPAKSQGNCGSCWDFAAIGTLESIIKIREENPDLSIDLSEQYVLSCLPAAANNYGQGCLGGTPYGAFYYMMDTSAEGNYENGAIPESCFPYQASHNIPCSEKCENWEDLLIPILDCSESYLGFDSPENRAIIKSLIYQNGPIAGAMNATQDFINFWNNHHDPTDYYPDPHAPWGNRLNHIIVIVGWKNDSSITNGGYWICKNSWGTSWGYQGFYNIEYGALFTGYYISTVDYDPESNNLPPTIPTINGSNEGTPGNEYIYTLTSEDPDDDEICYLVDWGDDTSSGWSDFVESGTPVTVSHTWAEKDTYTIAAKAKDEYGLESDWATLEVVMPINQQVLINPLLQMLLERFPNAFLMLRYLLGL